MATGQKDDAADQLVGLDSLTFDYDDNGNQTERGSDTFAYDHENRLVESVIDSVTFGKQDLPGH